MFRFSLKSGMSWSAAAVVAAAAVTMVAPSAMATGVSAGGTIDPLPGASLPAGSTLEYTHSEDFSYMTTGYINSPNGPLPVPRPVSGSITQRVYRLTDNTITFAYTMTNNDTSQNDITDMYVREFSDYTTDVFQSNGLVIVGTQSVSSAQRSADGSNIKFTWDSGLSAGNPSRTAYVRTDATAYYAPGRYVPVSSRATVCTGGVCVSVYAFAYPVEDSTPPIVSITSPAQLADVCNPAAFTGTAYDPNGFDEYKLERSSGPNGPWTTILTSTTPVSSNGPLGSWNTTGVSQGYYFVRLTATNTTGMSSSVTTAVFVDKQFDTVDVRSPQTGQILGGGVCFDGSVNDGNGVAPQVSYTVSYAPLPAASPFLPVDPANPVYPQGVINDGLAGWITSSGPAAVADGNYRVRVIGTDHCGNTKTTTKDIVIDNTAPIATITSPAACASINPGTIVQITGEASDLHMAGWAVQYTGGDAHTWVTIASGNTSASGVLANWNTAGLRPCAYVLRIIAGDGAAVNCGSNNNQREYFVGVNLGCSGDFNHSGGVSVQDIFDFLNAYFAGCP